jgi:guanylate kinase
VAIFIMPPSMEALQERLEARGTDSPEAISVRLRNAEKEMAQQNLYHHVIVNDQLSIAVSELITIIENYRVQ